MVDFTNYSEKSLLQLLKCNDKYCRKIATAKNWHEVVTVIDSLNIVYTNEQLNYVKAKQWNK